MRPQAIVLLLFVVSANAAWSEWAAPPAAMPCSVTCGYCGVRVTRTRTCAEGNGKCSGPSQQYEECGAKMCKFVGKGSKTCCAGYEKGHLTGGGFECVPKANIQPKKGMV
ncbi:hypothetical protein PENTCL1PPCAC_21022 [Pristionchus entomophagus]|uniref:Uncharacterized protein n=1 Tax=Pristionchus entomophagus TaxID=358040 RepID=A0AAV5TWV0_9BILA|nr:hypothetical protein PENTCL1PPCAC_21022 [Pristionchus entomophagus]